MDEEPANPGRALSALVAIEGNDYAILMHALSALQNPEGDATLLKIQRQVVRQFPSAVADGGF